MNDKEKHPDAKPALQHWYRLMKGKPFRSFVELRETFPSADQVVFVPHSESEYQRLVRLLDTLIDVVGENEHHPLASLMEAIGVLIEKYEDEHVPKLTTI